MRKLYLLLILFFGLNILSQAQPYHNEWIPFANGQQYSTQQYFRISIWKEGIYQITYNDMLNSGMPVTSWFNPQRYQLFNNGEEQFVKVMDSNGDNVFNPGDYIEFYGKGADGKLDAEIYDDPSSQANTNFSLFNDTAVYFLTYNPFSINNRRMPVEADTLFSGFTPEQYFVKEEYKGFTSEYNIGYRDYNEIADNSYTIGEGYFSYKVPYNQVVNADFTIQKYYSSGSSSTAEVVIAGANANRHPYEVRAGGVTSLTNVIFGYDLARHNLTLSNIPASGNYSVVMAPLVDLTNSNNANYMQLAYVKLRYPRRFDFSGETFPQWLNINSTFSKAYVELNNVNAVSPRMYVVSDDTIKQVVLNLTATPVRALIPVNGSEQKCFVIGSNQLFSMSGNAIIQSVNTDPDPNATARFTNYLEAGANADFLIVSNKKIWNGALNYKNYRAISGHTPLLADVNELYDQFAWGIRKHPLAIRAFADYLIDQTIPGPKFLFLLGKSVLSNDARSGNGYDLNLVPTFGEPASDQMFTAKLNSNEFRPDLATGRISAQNEADITAYLDKVIAFEAQQKLPPAPWMKNVLHFGGGTDINEQNELASRLNVYKQIIEDTLFGGKVTTFLKSSTAPIQINQSQFLQQMIDSGCSMMTFYGHAAGTSFDIATDDPENYNNKGRYPVVLANSCYVGDIHSQYRLLNERFVLTPDKGSVAFIAVPDKGIIESLDDYSGRFHEVLFREAYGKSVGECMQTTVTQIVNPDFNRKSVCMNMTLHGDPSLIVNSYSKPDYAVENSSIFFEPAQITTQLDSFTVKIAISNLGKNTNQTMSVLLSRTFPDQITKRDTIVVSPFITYRDTISIKLPVDFRAGSGLNDFQVTVDVYDEVEEVDDIGNNIARAQLIINSTDINPVFPQEFAIIPTNSVNLKATTADLFSKPKNYRFEIDTTPFFNSAQFKSGTVNQTYGIVNWNVPGTLDSNIVYFWRVANDSIMNPDTSISKNFQWKNSSFIYKQGITGWSQAHYYQYKQSSLTNTLLDDNNRLIKFVLSQFSLMMSHTGNRPSYDINGINMDYGGCSGAPQLAIAVLDSVDFTNPWNTDTCIANMNFGNYNLYSCTTGRGCNRNRPDRFFLFDTSVPSQNDSLVSMIQNKIPNGDYILAWTVFPVNFPSLPSNLKNTFVQLGAAAFPTLTSTEKFMMFSRKGDPSITIFKKGLYPDSVIRIDYLFSRDWDKGYLKSSQIGPAKQWTTLHWDYRNLETINSADIINLQVVGITPANTEVVLIDNITTTADVDLSTIDANQYPNLKLKAYLQDSQDRTPAQLNYWQVYYVPVPEGSLNTKYYTFYKDSIQEGDKINFSMAFENISQTKMDTLLVDYFLYDANNVRRSIGSVRLNRDLPPGDTIMTTISFNSQGFAGINNLWIEANPRNDQPEQYHFNNLASLRFFVSRDITNPLLDVTFDGAHILNGDIVSSKPTIQMQLLDENRFIALNDTSNYRVSLKDPSGQSRFIYFESTPGTSTDATKLKWTPATLPKNSFRIDYNPELLADGIYELDVQATDESGNLSGQNDYRIQFEVINKSTITEVVNYPNPFSTSTRFVFVLTGSEIPSEFKIQVMTITGKIVREITKDELGNIKIGRNLTDYAWDGKDEFGDQLANGVYLYHVITKLNGSGIEKRETNADKGFKKGWGKMYLMR